MLTVFCEHVLTCSTITTKIQFQSKTLAHSKQK